MADKIFINTDTYVQLAARLTTLADALGDCAAVLARTDTGCNAGGTLRIRISGSLRSTGASLPEGKIAACVSSMRTIIRGLRDHTSALADHVYAASELFENVETELAETDYAPGVDAAFSHGGGHRQQGMDAALGSLGLSFGGAIPIDTVLNLQEAWDQLGSRLHEATSISHELGESFSIFSGSYAVENAKGGVTAAYEILSAQWEAGGEAHIFDADGNLRPGTNVSVGGSVTVFDANCSAEYEVIDNVTIHSDASVTAGEASAGGELSLGFDKDGDFNINADLSAEIIAFEAEGEIGVDVAGMDVSAKGSVNVGLGAHANAGYKDGVLSLDIGLSVGVGASATVEIDVGDFADNVRATVSEKLESISGSAERAWDFVSNLI